MLKKMSLGDLLVKKKLVTQEQLEVAMKAKQQSGEKLGKTIISLGYISEEDYLEFLSAQMGIPFFKLKQSEIDFQFSRTLSEAYARRFHVLLLQAYKDGFLLGITDPLDLNAIDELKRVLKRPVYFALVRETALFNTLDLIYRRTEDIRSFAEELHEEVSGHIKLADFSVEEGEVDAPVVRLLQSVFEDAVQIGASDIHVEPGEKNMRIRMRIDGVLHDQLTKERSIAPSITLRLKLMAGLNISERRVPQDGRFNIKVRDKFIDVRLSFLPTQYGESIVMRLLDQSAGALKLDQVGMPQEVIKKLRRLFTMPNRILLVTGPTGSGKTTTLYGILNELNSTESKIITAEDPVEYRLPGINQSQIVDKVGFTFSSILRSMLRQDPDIIMVGEIRDSETADIAMRAALTGHLVLSTLHTNDSASSALRLLDMGVEGFLIAATLRGILAQRLVRRICDNCKVVYDLSEEEKNWLVGVAGADFLSTTKTFYHGKGCSYCNRSGYKGRIGIYELLELNQPMMEALREKSPGKFEKAAADALKGKLLIDRGLALVASGVTTVRELVRTVGGSLRDCD